MADKEYKIVFTADPSKYLAAAKQVTDSLDALDARTRTVNTGFQSLGQAASAGFGNAVKAAGGYGKALDEPLEKHSGLLDNLKEFGVSISVFALASKAAFSLGDALNDSREKMREMSDQTAEWRDRLREVANLKGLSNPDETLTLEQARFGVETGLDKNESRQFQEQFLGTIPAARSKGNIDDATAEKISVVGAQFGARVGLSADTAGDLTALIPGFEKIKDEKQFAGRLGSIAYGLNEGRGNLTPLAKSLADTAGGLVDEGGTVKSLSDLAAILGVASQGARPRAAGTRVRQAFQGLDRFDGERGEFLKRQGIKPGDELLSRLHAIAPFIQQDRATASNRLHDAGLHNVAENRAIIQFVDNLKVIDDRIKKSRAIAGDGSPVLAANADFLGNSKAGRARVGKASLEAGKFLQGREGEELRAARLAAEGELHAEGAIDTEGTTATDRVLDGFGLFPALGFGTHRQKRIDDRVDVRRRQQMRPADFLMDRLTPRHFDAEEQARGLSNKNPTANQSGEAILRALEKIARNTELSKQEVNHPPLGFGRPVVNSQR